MMKKVMMIVVSVLIALALVQCGGEAKQEVKEDLSYQQGILSKVKPMFAVVPDKMPGFENDTDARIKLGEKLYFETALSNTGDMSCNTCHDIATAGVDNKPTSEGTNGIPGPRNSPTVLNAGFHFVQFWDGRAADLNEQAGGPILNPAEMAIPDSATAVANIKAIPEYKALFTEAFGENSIDFENITEAMAAFERTLVTHDRFDSFLKGDLKAITKTEVEGLDLFLGKACVTCHMGSMLGANMYQKNGLIKPYKDLTDEGRFEVTGLEQDKFMFKVPALRNIGLTGPYFHDGGVESLEETIIMMGDMQLMQQISAEEAAKIAAFLKTMDGKQFTKG
ncbi:MAG: c-type cytochrome [Candidatus Marinimicrobia bacterium]|jgi:cytochrome c peroxidase|nr:c-type cytochrome [Candidatus Neomarinimicrobiota bacterium]MBT3632633.1 c-type cytochrome [Candidatus Neomarinimicrobiota bacterium]MBT3823805.1 c-type cytochrome [Candidatus Neomarinimicrobiota bacterium]MBT4130787.1 c-type cytochrome [Candidatus Neomarinimicrobiota bacterium]MBT4294756.1 c-type cytochrome [Candidatus Neomarinimicrobiota bacterium]